MPADNGRGAGARRQPGPARRGCPSVAAWKKRSPVGGGARVNQGGTLAGHLSQRGQQQRVPSEGSRPGRELAGRQPVPRDRRPAWVEKNEARPGIFGNRSGPAQSRRGGARGRSALRRRRHAGHQASARGPRLQLSRRQGPPDQGPQGDRPPQAAGHPACLDRRLDLPRRQGPPAGDRARCEGPQAVSLPPRLAHAPRRRQVRPHARLRPGAAAASCARGRRPGAPRAAAREGPGDRRAPPRGHAHPGRQSGICPRQSQLRADHHARPPRRLRGRRGHLRVPRQGRQAAPHRRCAIAASPASCAPARRSPASSSSSTSTRKASGRRSIRRTSTPICRMSQERRSRPRTSAPGRERCWPRSRSASSRASIRKPPPSAT